MSVKAASPEGGARDARWAIAAAGSKGLGIQLGGRLARLVYEIVVGRSLGAAGYGLLAVATSVFELVRTIAYAGLDHALVRFVTEAHAHGDRERERRVLLRIWVLAGVMALVVAVALVVGAGFLALRVFEEPRLVFGLRMVGVALIPNVVLIMAAAALRARGHFGTDRALMTVVQPVFLAAVMLISLQLHRSLETAFVAFAVAYGLAGLLGLAACYRAFRDVVGLSTKRNDAAVGPLLPFAALMAMITLGSIALMEAGRLLLAHFGDPRAVAVYTAASRLSVQVTVFHHALDAVASPAAAGLLALGKMRTLEESVQMLTFLSLALAMPLMLVLSVDPGMLLTFFGAGFDRAAEILWILVAAQGTFVVLGPTSRLLQMSGRARLDVANTFASLALTVILAMALIPALSFWGAAIASATGIVFLKVLQWIEVRQLLRVQPVGVNSLAALAAGLLGGAAGVLVREGLAPGWARFAIVTGVGIGVYAFALGLLLGVRTPRAVGAQLRDVIAQLGGRAPSMPWMPPSGTGAPES